MKKLIALCVAMLLCVSLLSVTALADADPTLSVSNETGIRGENVTVSVDVSENSNMYGGNATIEYDTTAFELVNSEIGDVIKNSSPILNTAYQGNRMQRNLFFTCI